MKTKTNELTQEVNMEKPICSHCGSDNVVKDAWAEWDITTQAWELQSTYDDAYCNNCAGETTLEWAPVDVSNPN